LPGDQGKLRIEDSKRRGKSMKRIYEKPTVIKAQLRLQAIAATKVT
jgi:hypothetical protein